MKRFELICPDSKFLFFIKCVDERDLAGRLERPTVITSVATVQGSIPASSDTVKSEERQMKQCGI
jgi:hypothetical protein